MSFFTETEPLIHDEHLHSSGFVAECRLGTLTVSVGIWVMPDNQSPGQLEDFVLRLVVENDPAILPARQYIERLPEDYFALDDHRVGKHVAHSWLSAYHPGWSFDDALKSGQLEDPSRDAVGMEFLDWLRRLSS